jgi:predicted amidophosphoribosyltransferase
MGLRIETESCRGCRRAISTIDSKCPRCGYDYYEEIYNHKRPPEGMSLDVCQNLEKLFGKTFFEK